MIRIIIYLMAFTCGFAVMTIEMMGGRILAPWFGGSIYIWGSIISIFLVALSLGYLVGGYLSLNNPTLRRYGWFFITSALTLLPIIFLSDLLMDKIFVITEDPRYGSLIAASIMFFIPAFIMGMISPYSIRLLVKTEEESGHTAGRLYFVSTLGSALGTIGTAFYFVLYFEIDQILIATLFSLLMPGIFCQISHWSPKIEAST